MKAHQNRAGALVYARKRWPRIGRCADLCCAASGKDSCQIPSRSRTTVVQWVPLDGLMNWQRATAHDKPLIAMDGRH